MKQLAEEEHKHTSQRRDLMVQFKFRHAVVDCRRLRAADESFYGRGHVKVIDSLLS